MCICVYMLIFVCAFEDLQRSKQCNQSIYFFDIFQDKDSKIAFLQTAIDYVGKDFINLYILS